MATDFLRMHPLATDAIVESVRRRVSQGDCASEPAHSVETLEECILELASRASRSFRASSGDGPTPEWCMREWYRVNPGASETVPHMPSLYLLDFARAVLRQFAVPPSAKDER